MLRASSEAMTKRKLTAFTMKHQPMPIEPTTTAAMAGPTTRATLTSVELSVTALRTSAGPTTSETKAWRAGLSTALKVPNATARTNTCQSRTTPESTARPRSNETTPRPAWVTRDVPLGQAVDEQPGVGGQHQDGAVAGSRRQPQQDGRVGELQDEQPLGHGLHPGTDEAEALAAHVAAEVWHRQGGALVTPPFRGVGRRCHRAPSSPAIAGGHGLPVEGAFGLLGYTRRRSNVLGHLKGPWRRRFPGSRRFFSLELGERSVAELGKAELRKEGVDDHRAKDDHEQAQRPEGGHGPSADLGPRNGSLYSSRELRGLEEHGRSPAPRALRRYRARVRYEAGNAI